MQNLSKKKKAKVSKAADQLFGAKPAKQNYAAAFKTGAPIPKGVTMAPKGYKPKFTP